MAIASANQNAERKKHTQNLLIEKFTNGKILVNYRVVLCRDILKLQWVVSKQ